MCFDSSASPPPPPIAGGAGIAGADDVVLEATDGNHFGAFSARAADPEAPGIAILPDVRGLHSFYRVLAGVVGFYGFPQQRDPKDDVAPVVLAKAYACPVLGLFGGADSSVPPEAVEEFRSALDRAGIQNELVVYDGAPHSFFDRKAD